MVDWDDLQQSVLNIGLDTFGKEHLYRPHDSAPVVITAIFETSYQSVDPNTGVAVISTRPRLSLDPSDLPREPQEGDIVETDKGNYIVSEYHSEGAGGGYCLLHEL